MTIEACPLTVVASLLTIAYVLSLVRSGAPWLVSINSLARGPAGAGKSHPAEASGLFQMAEADDAGFDDSCLNAGEKLLAEIWEREKAQVELEAKAARFKALFELAPDAVFLEIPDKGIVDANLAAEKKFGYTRGELKGMRIADLAPPGAAWACPDASGRPAIEAEGLAKDRRVFPVEIRSRAIKLPDGPALLVVVRDVTQRKNSESELKTLTMAVEQSPASVIITDPEGSIVYVNQRFTETTGYGKKEVLGQTPRIFSSGRQSKTFYRELWDTISSGRQWRGEICNRTKDGGEIWELASISPVTDDRGRLLYYVSVKEDITEKKRREKIIKRMALYDFLTGLPNRALLMDRLDLALAQSERSGDHAAVLYLDLDGFKKVNDGFGHEAGDKVLEQAGKRIEESIRKGDTAARIGGDEFVIVLRAVKRRHDVDATALRLIRALDQPFEISGRTFTLGASIGVSLAPEHSTGRDELIRMADHAMYRVKAAGKNAYRYYDPSMDLDDSD